MPVIINGKTCGVTTSGFARPLLEDLKAELENSYRTIYGNPNLAADAVFGQEIAVKSKILTDLWEILESVYNTFDPSSAVAAALDNILSLCLLSRREAIKTEVTCLMQGVATTVIPAGSIVANDNNDQFEAMTDYTIAGGGSVQGVFIALVAGPVAAVAGTVTKIVTPVSGWNSVNNLADGTIGRLAETDAEARLRRSQSLQAPGAGTIGAIQSAILNNVSNVSACSVIENVTDETDVYGVPPHAIHYIVSGGTDQDVADMIWEKKPAGIQTFGNTEATIVDGNGESHTIFFSRPIYKYIHLTIYLTQLYPEESFPADGDDRIKAACVAFADTLTLGKDLINQRWFAPVYTVPGLAQVDIFQAVTDNPGDTPSFVSDNIAIGQTSIAVLEAVRITVNHFPPP